MHCTITFYDITAVLLIKRDDIYGFKGGPQTKWLPIQFEDILYCFVVGKKTIQTAPGELPVPVEEYSGVWSNY